MAILLNKQTQQSIVLQSQHSFGRLQHSVITFISDSVISRVHATIEWALDNWFLRDTSVNGTWYNGKRLLQGEDVKLKVGDEISFAHQQGQSFVVSDVNPPCDYLIPIGHDSDHIELKNLHLLFNDKINNNSVILNYNHKTQTWWQEQLNNSFFNPTAPIELSHQEHININGLVWQLQMNRAIDSTHILKPTITSLDELILHIYTRSGKGKAQLFLQIGEEKINLHARKHHKVTLMLARKKYQDIQAGLTDNEQGWLSVEKVTKTLNIDESHLNIYIYRIREQFNDIYNHLHNSNNIVERSSGMLRLRIKSFFIVGDNTS